MGRVRAVTEEEKYRRAAHRAEVACRKAFAARDAAKHRTIQARHKAAGKGHALTRVEGRLAEILAKAEVLRSQVAAASEAYDLAQEAARMKAEEETIKKELAEKAEAAAAAAAAAAAEAAAAAAAAAAAESESESEPEDMVFDGTDDTDDEDGSPSPPPSGSVAAAAAAAPAAAMDVESGAAAAESAAAPAMDVESGAAAAADVESGAAAGAADAEDIIGAEPLVVDDDDDFEDKTESPITVYGFAGRVLPREVIDLETGAENDEIDFPAAMDATGLNTESGRGPDGLAADMLAVVGVPSAGADDAEDLPAVVIVGDAPQWGAMLALLGRTVRLSNPAANGTPTVFGSFDVRQVGRVSAVPKDAEFLVLKFGPNP